MASIWGKVANILSAIILVVPLPQSYTTFILRDPKDNLLVINFIYGSVIFLSITLPLPVANSPFSIISYISLTEEP